MIYTIHKGRHRAWPWGFSIFRHPRLMVRRVTFFPNCRYQHSAKEDYDDSNKLFGFGFFWNHKEESARFGWYYNSETKKIQLQAYCYVNGVRYREDICELNPAWPYDLHLHSFNGKYWFKVFRVDSHSPLAQVAVSFTHTKTWCYGLRPFFGGNNPAPHKMQIELKKIKH